VTRDRSPHRGGRVRDPGSRQELGSDPRTLVLGVLHAVQREGRSTAVALDRALRPLPPGPERSFITDVVYGTLRWLPTLDAALAARLPEPGGLPDHVRDALRAGSYERLVRQTPAHAAVHAWVDAVKRAGGPAERLAGLVNAVLRRVDLADAGVRAVREDEAPAFASGGADAGTTAGIGVTAADAGGGAAVGLPPALWRHLHAALGPHAAAAARAMLRPEPVWLTAYRDDAVERLRAEGAEVRPGPIAGSWSVRPGRPLGELEAFRSGAVQPQNPASAAVVAALGAVDGRTVLDVGSGHGVKAAQLAAAGAHVIAVELDPRRAEAGRRNLARLGLAVEHRVADATTPLGDVPLVDMALLDAPCTGTGTLRGHPEIKLRWRPEDAMAAAGRQSAMLRVVAERVRPGGRLLYAVCALGLDEGPDVVGGFLAADPAWRAIPPTLPLPSVPAPVGHWLLPDASGLDGFYLALLERAGPADAPPAGG
jgi:16S rRNA (cytosine967-C5)-methyltransferase